MIGQRFVHYLRDVPPRPMVKLNLFLSTVRIKIAQAASRANHLTTNGNGTRLLTAIIKTSDLSVMLSSEWSTEDKTRRLIQIVRDLEKHIDPRLARHLPKRLFVASRMSCFEMVVPTRRPDPVAQLPLGLPYDQWRDVKPLRLCEMGSCDFPIQLQNDLLYFKNNSPTHVVFALDCVALVGKFIAYYEAQPHVSNLDQCILDFLHREVIVPCLLNDGVSVWLRNVFRSQILSQSRLEYHTSTLWDVVNIDTLGSDFNGAMDDIHRLRRDLLNQTVSPQTALASLIIGTQGESFTDWYKDLYYTTTIPDQQPWLWVECLKNLSWFEFILSITSFNTTYPDVVSFQRDIVRDLRFWTMMKPWQEVSTSIPYRSQVRARLEGMQSYLAER